MRRLAVVAALAAGLLLVLSFGSGCSLGCPTPEERTYLEAGENWSERTIEATEDLRTILREGGRRSGALIDEGWQRRLKRVLDELTSAQEAIINVEVPARGEETHRTLVRIAESYIEGSKLLWQGVLDVDAETLQRGLDKYEESNLLAEEATEVVERFCE